MGQMETPTKPTERLKTAVGTGGLGLPPRRIGIFSQNKPPCFEVSSSADSAFDLRCNGAVVRHGRHGLKEDLPTWLWVKKRYPKWNAGKWSQRLKPAVPWWVNFDPYPDPPEGETQKEPAYGPQGLGWGFGVGGSGLGGWG